MMYIHSLGRAARYHPAGPAIVSGGQRITFEELHGRVARIAGALSTRGFRAGDRLALLLPNEPEYIELIYACSWLGVIAIPLNTRLSAPEIDHVLTDASPRGIIRHSSLASPTTKVPLQLVLDQELADLPDESTPEAIYDPEAVLALVYTSGTTGRPKGVMQTHRNTLANVNQLSHWLPQTEGGVHLHAAPIFHIMDLPFMFAAPAFGLCQVTIPKFTPEAFCQSVERERVTQTVLVPTMINLLLQFPELKQFDLSSLVLLAYGGSPMAPELVQRIKEVFPNLRLLQGYGLSETGFLTALQDHEHIGQRLTSCGRTPPGIDLRVVDDSGAELATGQRGEFAVRGENVMSGYWNNPEATSDAFRGEMFRTGDIGYQDAEGYFYILDRAKDMIVTGGENVYSGEVEAVLYTHPAVREAAVFGIPDPKWGEIVTACVVRKSGNVLKADELIAHCRRSLANYKVPRRVEVSETELPKSGSGKILKRVLRERYWVDQERAVS